jgi:hypothetical protein
MHLNPYVANVRRELAAVAESGGDEMRDLAVRLTSPLEAAIRLTLLEALSDAAAEITRELAPGSVDVRLRGADPEFVVSAPAAGAGRAEPAAPAGAEPVTVSSLVGVRLPEGADDEGADGGMVRINLRLPAHLKGRIEAAADELGVSVNAWIVRAAAAGLENEVRVTRTPDPPRTRRGVGGSYTGWAR